MYICCSHERAHAGETTPTVTKAVGVVFICRNPFARTPMAPVAAATIMHGRGKVASRVISSMCMAAVKSMDSRFANEPGP